MNKQRKAKKEIEYLHWKCQGKIALSEIGGVIFSHRKFGAGRVVEYSSQTEMVSILLLGFGPDTIIYQTLSDLLGENSNWKINWKSMHRIAPETKEFWIGSENDVVNEEDIEDSLDY